MTSLLSKTLGTVLAGLVGGAAIAVGNALGTRYLVPLVEAKLPSRTTEADDRPQDMPIRAPGMAGMPPR